MSVLSSEFKKIQQGEENFLENEGVLPPTVNDDIKEREMRVAGGLITGSIK